MGANERWETIKNEARPYRGLGGWIAAFLFVVAIIVLVALLNLYEVL
jgi:hypothetical protein